MGVPHSKTAVSLVMIPAPVIVLFLICQKRIQIENANARGDLLGDVGGCNPAEEKTKQHSRHIDPDIDCTFESLLAHFVNVLKFLSPRAVFEALPAVATSWRRLCSEDTPQWIKAGVIWLTPITSSQGIEEVSLESLYVQSLRESWFASTRQNYEAQRNKSVCCGFKLGGPIHHAVRRSDPPRSYSLVRGLLSWRANANGIDSNGWTPLLWAANKNSVELCQLLLSHEADVNHMGSEGSTALKIACRSGDVEMVKVLLAAGADPDQINIRLQMYFNSSEIADSQSGNEILKLLSGAKKTADITTLLL